MIASAVNPSYMSTDPLVLVPPHPMASTTSTPFFFGAGLAVSPQTARPLQSLYGAPTFDPVHASPIPHQFPSLPLHHAQSISNHSNDMMIDEPAPASPSSSNSTEQDDEESAALILHALESGSLSPRGSPQTHPLHAGSRGFTSRQRKVTTISPATPRRKRISSLTEIADTSSSAVGKESAMDDFDLSMHDTYAAASPPQHSHQQHHHHHHHHHGHGHRGSIGANTSWSLPSTSGFTFAQSNYAAQFVPAGGSPARQQGLSSSSTQPISIPRPKPTTSGAFGAYSPSHSHSHASSPSMPLSSTAPSSSSSSKKMRRTPRARLENHQCPNCHTSDSPLWRNCLIKGKILHLCNSCGLRYKKHKYCPHCYKVYYDAETNVHDWTQCVQCHNWTHRQCLNDAGIDPGLPGTYKCLRCLGLLPDCD